MTAQSRLAATPGPLTIGVLALQGGFIEHINLVRAAAERLAAAAASGAVIHAIEVRTPAELARCDGLIIPGGESTTISFVAAQSGLLEPLREFVKYVCQNRRGARASERTRGCLHGIDGGALVVH